jgi:DNA-binding transcriptional regulator GbsR (MarR family)
MLSKSNMHMWIKKNKKKKKKKKKEKGKRREHYRAWGA